MAPGRGGKLWVSIPAPGGSVLALLDAGGRPRSGWPVVLAGATQCALPPPADDGSVRVVCSHGTDDGQRAFGFDSDGRPLLGWPVELPGRPWQGDQRVIGDKLTIIAVDWLDGVVDPETGGAASEAWLVTVAADGAVETGVRVRDAWVGRLGPDGIAYSSISSATYYLAPELSRITAFDLDGVRAGWPVRFDGVASEPAFGPGGRVYLTVGSFERPTSHTLVFDRGGQPVSVGSGELPIVTAEWGSEGSLYPEPPVVAEDGTIFVFSAYGTTVVALDSSGQLIAGWPYRAADGLMRPGYCPPESELGCSFSLATPAVGPGDVLHLLRPAPDVASGGSATAIGPNGLVRPGWPITLRRAGSEFWSIVTGPDGTSFALAVEPEGAHRSSATILAIAEDGTVRYRTTVVEP